MKKLHLWLSKMRPQDSDQNHRWAYNMPGCTISDVRVHMAYNTVNSRYNNSISRVDRKTVAGQMVVFPNT